MVNRDLKYIPEEYRSQMESIPNSEIKRFLNPDKSNIGTQFFGGLQSNDIDVINQIQIAMNTVNTAKGQNVAFSQLYQYLRTGNKLMLSREGNFRNIIASLDYNKVAKYYDLIQKGFNNQTSEVERDIIKIMELHNEVKERVGYEADYGLLKFINPYDRNYGRYEAISSNKGAREILQKYTPAQVAAVLQKMGYNIGNVPTDNTILNYNNSVNNNPNRVLNLGQYITKISKDQLYENIRQFVSEFVNGKKIGQNAYSTLIRLNCPIKSEPSTNMYYSFMNRFSNITTVQNSWNHVHTPRFDLNNVNHRLYINADFDMTYKFLELFANKCETLGIEYYFKTTNNPTGMALSRSESAVIYASEEMIIKYIELCQEIKREHPELQFYSPPAATASIDGWFGYGAEPSVETKQKLNNEGINSVSFNVVRAHIIDKAINRGVLDFVNTYGNSIIKNGKTTNQLYIDALYLSIAERYNITEPNNKNALYQHLLKYSDYYINCLKENGVFSVGNYTASTETANMYMYNYINDYSETYNFITQEIKNVSIEYGVDPDNFAINISN